jgi:hypothetical protein
MAHLNLFKSRWLKIFSFLTRTHIANKCGHRTRRAGWAKAFRERYFVEMPLAVNGSPDYCLACIGSMAILCAWCGRDIHIGEPITLYTPRDKHFVLPEHAVRHREEPLQVVGCLRWGCAETGGDRAGFWVPPGEVLRVPTVFEQLLGSDDSDAVVIADVGDLHDVGTVIGKKADDPPKEVSIVIERS